MGELVSMSVAGAAMVLAVLVARALLLKRLPKWAFTTLWALVVVRLLVPLWVPAPTSVLNLAALVQPSAPAQQPADDPSGAAGDAEGPSTKDPDSAATAKDLGTTPTTAADPASEAGRDGTDAGVAVDLAGNPEGARPVGASHESIPEGGAAPFAVVVAWAVGAIGCGGCFALSYRRFRQKLKPCLPVEDPKALRWIADNGLHLRTVRIRQSDRVDGPLTFGIVRPTVVVPCPFDWDSEHARYALEHELAHIRRLDVAFKLLLVAAACVHWFNPLAWAMLVFANRDIELACDEAAVLRLGAASRFDYARALLDLEESRIPAPALRTGFGASELKERIEAIMTTRRNSALAAAASMLLIVAVPAAFATSATSATTPSATDESSVSEQAPATEEAVSHDIPETTYDYSDEDWATVIELWEYVQDESVSVADLCDAMAAAGLSAQSDGGLLDTMRSDLRLNAARYGNDLAAFACNVLCSLDAQTGFMIPASDSSSFEVGGGVAGLSYNVAPSLNSDPSDVSALALHRTLADALDELGSLFDDDKLFYLEDIFDKPVIMGYALDDVLESLLGSELPGIDLEVTGQYSFRSDGTDQGTSGPGVFSAAIEGPRVLDFEFPVNENGQTYGSMSDIEAYLPARGSKDPALMAMLPDLVAMIGDNGVSGYVAKEDMYDYSENGPRAQAALEALEAGEDSYECAVPIYAQDGETVVDELTMHGTFTTLEHEDGAQEG